MLLDLMNTTYRRSDFRRRDILLRRRGRVPAGRGVLGMGAEVKGVQRWVAVVMVGEGRVRRGVVRVVTGELAIVVVAGNELWTSRATWI